MPRYRYQAFVEGRQVSGNIRADNLSAAEETLLTKGVLVDEIRPAGKVKGLKDADLLDFARGMASLTRTGVRLSEAGALWIEDLKDPAPWDTIFARVNEGTPLSTAMDEYGGFPAYMVSMIQIGEATGSLHRSFEKTATYLRDKQQLRNTVISALTYPMVVLVVAVIAMAVLFTKVLPIFEQSYRRFGNELPIPTKMLMEFMAFLQQFGIYFFLGFLVAGLLFKQWLVLPRNRLRFDRFIYKVPVVGSLMALSHNTLFCTSLSHLLDSGVGLLEALSLVVVPNRHMRLQLNTATDAVARGIPLSESLQEQGLLEPKLIRMISLGEESGEMSRTLEDSGMMLAERLERKLKRFTTLFEPILIVTLALVIGTVLIALYLPMFDIVSIME